MPIVPGVCLGLCRGSELVAKGATKKIDGQLPELGSKEVSPSGSWLEQKQIQSMLEARKHLIEVERIEKNGSLSHAVWKDDLKLAEVVKKAGGHWQFIGHNVGKCLYLLPEEALFLIEVNCLLLKHNEVTVSLQKAYSLCLGDQMSITQYKVYASLSRLGYRVFRHKEPTPDSKYNIISFKENIRVTDASEKCLQTSQNVPVIKTQSDNGISNDLNKTKDVITNQDDTVDDEQKEMCSYDAKMEIGNNEIGNSISNNENVVKIETGLVNPVEIDSIMPLVHAENIKVEFVENHTGTENTKNNTVNSVENPGEDSSKEFIGTTDKILSINKPANNESVTILSNECISNEDIKMVTGDDETKTCNKNEVIHIINESVFTVNGTTMNQDNNLPTFKEKATQNIVIENNSLTDTNYNTSIEDSRNNANERTRTSKGNNINEDKRIAIINEIVYVQKPNTVIQDIVYSVDQSGVIRVSTEDTPMETVAVQPSSAAAPTSDTTETTAKDSGSCVNNSAGKQYDAEITHYRAKVEKLIDRKSNTNQRNNIEGFNTIQDFYREQVVKVNVPDEKYLPRNIFLHKTAYVMNVDVVRNQNASNANASSDEMDLNEPPIPVSRGTDGSNLPNLPRFDTSMPFNNTHTRYPLYRPTPPQWSHRGNYPSYYTCNMVRPPPQSFFLNLRCRYQPQAFIRHAMNYNMNAPGASGYSQTNKQPESLKKFHLDAIIHIASRFRKGVGRCVQVQALNNLLCTYNARYNEHLELTREFDIVDSQNPAVREVIVLDDDEPPSKKARKNDDADKINKHLDKLKELATKLKDLHTKNLAVSRHRRVFSNAIRTFNKSFNADLYLDSNFEIKDRKLIVLDSSSDSDLAVKEKNNSKKRKRLRNPYSILKLGLNNVNVGASTSREVPILQRLSLNVINEITHENQVNASRIPEKTKGEGLLQYFDKVWLLSDDDFGRAELCSRKIAQLDSYLFEAEYLYDVMKESVTEFQSWVDLKLAILKEIQETLDIQKQQAEALSNDFMETESQMKPILDTHCTDLKSALKKLAIIPTNKETPKETSLRIHFDVCNREVHFKKSNPPKPNFRVICYEESAAFPSSNDVVGLQAKYNDGVPTVFAFVGVSGSISYLQINSIDLPVFIPEDGDM